MILKKQNIFITGANRGIGLALAKQSARLGLNVHAICRTPNTKLQEEVLKLGASSFKFWKADLSDQESIDHLIKSIKESGTSVDILVNNAGLITGGLLEDQKIKDINKMLMVNLLGLIRLTHGLLPEMLKLGEAKIVNNSSVMGKAFIPCGSTYAASKAGVVGFTESLQLELKDTTVSTLLLITPAVQTDLYVEVEDIYSKNMDLSAIKPIAAEDWAKRVFEHIKKDKTTCWPQGFNKFTVKMGHHFPKISGLAVGKFFKR
jgi:short-subunit dehydrogenase